ncbi:DUF922 domain-containing protein [Cyclobacterium jeungdonense]|uniref:DUF922 domain-containing protein n=2 Tax=Cyclobacterium jeungdonense TaxID=708087 RepID=A0ABT8C997_9BACT|nr:hypothetical protein [Cyclobacterium jeungdonense]MDN3688213.1 hypothetical protein [Cyclobacterium jeungdonense]
MNRNAFLCVAAALLFCGSLLSGSIPKEPPKRGKVTVSPNRSLNWEDFKQVEVIRGTSSINAICLSTCEVEILKVHPFPDHVKLEINAKIHLQKDLSQVNRDFLIRSDEGTKKQVLHHENGHFFIAQIIGYRIVRDVNGYSFDPNQYKNQLNGIIRENFKNWKRLDSQYDAQTTKPRNADAQKRWDEFFTSELLGLRQEIYP